MTQSKFLTLRTVDGESQAVGELEMTPRAQILALRLPFARFVWNRPTAITVSKDGVTEQIPIVDVTRVAEIGIYIMAAFMVFVAWRLSNRQHHEEKEE